MIDYLDELGDYNVLILTGGLIGLMFGIFAQQSRFCLRAAAVELWRNTPGKQLAIWLLAFASALLGTQLLMFAGTLEVEKVWQLNNVGSLSGAIVGGLLFGVGMVLARGCASRLLVLAGTGNLRALTTGLILTLVAQMTLTGVLSPLRQSVNSLWVIDGVDNNLATLLPEYSGLILALLVVFCVVVYAWRNRLGKWLALTAVLTGATVSAGWFLTSWHASWSFEIIKVQSISFAGPSMNTLMALVNSPEIPKNFSTGLIPGVFLGALLASIVSGQFRIQKFTTDTGMVRYLVGALLMGVGCVLASGCSVGAGVTSGTVLAATGLLALLFMLLGAGVADLFLRKWQGINA